VIGRYVVPWFGMDVAVSDAVWGLGGGVTPAQPILTQTALLESVVAGAGVNPADQRWGFRPLLPLSPKLARWI